MKVEHGGRVQIPGVQIHFRRGGIVVAGEIASNLSCGQVGKGMSSWCNWWDAHARGKVGRSVRVDGGDGTRIEIDASITHVPRVGTGRGPRKHHLPRRNWSIAHGRDKREVALRGFVLSRSNDVRCGQHGVPTKVSKDIIVAGVQKTKLCRTGAGGHVVWR